MSWNSDVLVNSLRLLPLELSQQQTLWNAMCAGRPVVFVGGTMLDVVRFARSVASGWMPSDEVKAEIAAIYEAAGLTLSTPAPLRVPHFSTSLQGLVGRFHKGHGTHGEVSLAHGGVLLLDELTDFGPAEMMHLGHALQEKSVRLVSATSEMMFPARPRFVFGAVGACMCRHSGCSCSADMRVRHEARVAKYVTMLGATRVDVQDAGVNEIPAFV